MVSESLGRVPGADVDVIGLVCREWNALDYSDVETWIGNCSKTVGICKITGVEHLNAGP